jgi:hypothetical protein
MWPHFRLPENVSLRLWNPAEQITRIGYYEGKRAALQQLPKILLRQIALPSSLQGTAIVPQLGQWELNHAAFRRSHGKCCAV